MLGDSGIMAFDVLAQSFNREFLVLAQSFIKTQPSTVWLSLHFRMLDIVRRNSETLKAYGWKG
jgi:hypothetical protein